MRFRQLPSLIMMLLCVALVGCFGGSHNPSYFPWYLPPGDIIPTHAKPPGLGYFKNFDPKAVRLDVSPSRCSNPVNTQQVLIATVYDEDGDARRSRRVEWILDGPGHIVEVDESGYFPGRGYKTDNHHAVSYTDYTTHTIDRGNANPGDDFTIRPGQTWCVVSSGVEGETTVTAYAPGIHNWEKSRIPVKLIWSNARFDFPPPVVSRSGSNAELTTTLHRYDGKAIPDDLKVRYRIVGGAPAVLVGKGSPDFSTSLSGGQTETELRADAEGVAMVTLAQPQPTTGTTRVAVEVVKPGLGNENETIIESRETTVEWASPNLTLDLKAPELAGVGSDTPLSVVLANIGHAKSQPAEIHVRLPDDVEFVESEPAPASRNNGELIWRFAGLAADKIDAVKLFVKPTRLGGFTVHANAVTTDGLRAERDATISVANAGLRSRLEMPRRAEVGERLNAKLIVENSGAVPIANATAWLSADESLQLDYSKPTVEMPIGTIAVGESRTIDIPFIMEQPGSATLRANVTADGGLSDRVDSTIKAEQPPHREAPSSRVIEAPPMPEVEKRDAGPPGLVLEVANPPGVLTTNQRTSIRLTLRNRGTTSAQQVGLRFSVTPELQVLGGEGADRNPPRVIDDELIFGTIDELPPGATAVYVAEVQAEKAGAGRIRTEVQSRHLERPLHDEQAVRVMGNAN